MRNGGTLLLINTLLTGVSIVLSLAQIILMFVAK